jgi:hypothetical protein
MARSREQISDEAYDSFIRESAGLNLDMASFPSIKARQNKNAEAGSNFLDPRFAPLSDARPLRLPRALARFANDNHADREVAEVLKRGGVVDGSEGGEGLVHFTVSETGQDIEIEIRHIDGLWTGLVNGTKFNAPTRDGLLSAISRSLNNNVRNLTDAQLRECSLLVNTPNGGFYRAIQKYVAWKANVPEEDVLSDAMVLNPKLRRVFDEAVSFAWLSLRTDFVGGEDWPEFLAAYASGRAYSIQLLDGARQQYEKRHEEAARESLLSTVSTDTTQAEEPQAPSYRELDALTDTELSQHFRDTRREYAKQVRAGIL